ncbi:hypothetical protein [Mesorhizobium sp. M2A.F.Ca.ET.039.01.1.1]|uniref:hypothetical protein n=1 Tax=Mesorhizobium sp. M2A.F.Ca.ET.039.01.1.1 TaxID=2496746 RepID=UPI000FCCA8B7|nr:hypothetical protein [Mesorhizobium sp. M2A.F.Ca.ET.039.01.1.1]RWX72563.1 hypothetical protein EOA24_00805 [Mesorhizobium sp. M2A.F.Ca.ET.039.01.1.1]
MKTPADRFASAQAAYEAGFLSMAAKKRATDDLSRAYEAVRDQITSAILRDRGPMTTAPTEEETRLTDLYYSIPFDLHQVRDRHFEALAAYPAFEIVRDFIAMRAAIKAAPIAPAPVKPEIEVKAEKVRRSIIEEMQRHKQQYVRGLEVARLFGGLPVSVNAHWVNGHKGAVFLRHFFYLRGELTPLNTIIAIAETIEREQEGRS